MENREIGQIRFQHVTLARPPVRIQCALAHFGHGHERNDQLGAPNHVDVARREFRMPFQDKTGYVGVNDQPCRCGWRTGQYGAAHG